MSGSTTAAMLKFSLNHILLFGNLVKKIKKWGIQLDSRVFIVGLILND